MGRYKNAIRRIQAFMDSARGKTVLNYLYSWGAAIVILGTLFKLTHITGANLMLFVGMGTEVIVFFFSGFERPYDVAVDEKKEEEAEERAAATNIVGAGLQGGTIVINGTIGDGGNIAAPADGVVAASGTPAVSGAPAVIQGGAAITGNPDLIPQMDEVTEEYIEKVRALNDAIKHISEQANALGRNMEEMETLGRNLTGINALYETQLRSAGNQANAIDQVNEQTKKMAAQIEELNAMYARMIQAMTTNMNKPQI
ncbi:MAG: gliding motility protein GldL [Bacteroidaceae bacterium]|nr:gliding motility protein GldL [Bacteroidaceae bacterium]